MMNHETYYTPGQSWKHHILLITQSNHIFYHIRKFEFTIQFLYSMIKGMIKF